MHIENHAHHDQGHKDMVHDSHNVHNGHTDHGEHQSHVDHSGHEQMFQKRFWASLLLSIPVLIFSPSVQGFLGYTLPDFPGSNWITPLFSIVVFFYGGVPFLQMAVPEIKNRKPGMMTLISLAISVALFDLGGVIAVVAGMLTGGFMIFLGNRIFGGVNGDIFGATNEIARMVALFVLVI